MSPFKRAIWPSSAFYPFVVSRDVTGRESSRNIPPRVRDILLPVSERPLLGPQSVAGTPYQKSL